MSLSRNPTRVPLTGIRRKQKKALGKCPLCHTEMADAAGIGPYCPEPRCTVRDGACLHKVSHTPILHDIGCRALGLSGALGGGCNCSLAARSPVEGGGGEGMGSARAGSDAHIEVRPASQHSAGWRPRERFKAWCGGMDTEGEHVGEFTAQVVFASHADCVSFLRYFAAFDPAESPPLGSEPPCDEGNRATDAINPSSHSLHGIKKEEGE